jgi:hypothetical protein
MELINSTRMLAGYTMGIEPNGRELLVVVIKGTFRIPTEQGATLRLHEDQVPLVMSDVFYGEPGLSATKYEVDFAPRKSRCDVLLNANAYAPAGRPTTRVQVAAHIGNWSKSFAVVGDRVWEAAGVGIGASAPIPFTTMPITYDRAFGGIDNIHVDPSKHAAFMANPSGRGFHSQLVPEWMHGTPLPNTEEIGEPVTWANGNYKPMSFGAIGRHWAARVPYAGTYDQKWLDDVFPFLPADFNEQYYQTAPPDQQLPLPVGEQLVSLVNLTPEGRRDFVLPHLEAPIYVFPKSGDREELAAPVDTLIIEPDLERVMMTWRVSRPLKKNMFEISQVLVGRKGPEWWQQRDETGFPIPVVVERLASTQQPLDEMEESAESWESEESEESEE